MDESGTDSELGGLELALVSAAIEISKQRRQATALEPPANVQSVGDACLVIAEQGSPPLRVSVARDLAGTEVATEDLRPLLASTLTPGIEVTDDNLEKWRNELREAGPTVNWQSFAAPPEPPAG